MNDVALLWGIAAGAIIVLIAHAAFARHQRYLMYARFYRKWEECAIDAASSLQRLEMLDPESEELRRFVEIWRRHDRENFQHCVREAEYWRGQLPAWARESYLGGSA